ncbi:MAG TPA: MFS transporter [Dongiaceae bacterium]|nr:MFS transporter [Dongiaceae bacterium]
MTFFLNGAAFGGWAAQVPRATQRLEMDESTLGLVLLGMGVGAVAAMLFSGHLIARFGAGLLIRLSLVVFLVAYLALSTAPTLEVFAAAVLLFGAAGGLMDVAMNAYAADVEAHMDWRVMASFHGMWSVGGVVGTAAVSQLLAVSSDLTQALVLTVAIVLLFLTCQHHLVALRHHTHEKSKQRLVISRLTLVLALLATLSFSAEGAVRDWSSLFLTGDLQASIERAAWGYGAFSATMALCRLSGDWMRVRFGERNVVVTSAIIALIGFVLTIGFQDYILAVLGFALVGIGLSNIVPILISAAGRNAAPGPSIAFVVSFGYAGFLATPPILGFIAAQTSLATMFAVVAASCAVIAAGWLLVERTMAASPAHEASAP